MSRYWIAGASMFGLSVLATSVVWSVRVNPAEAHCQVPCGIYDDAARVAQLKEDATTIAKAMKGINDLMNGHDAQAVNQATRWVMTKEAHASHIIELLSEYFLCQRVKPAAGGTDAHAAYLKKLADHHAVMVAAMKTKQTADPASVIALNKAIDRLSTYY